MANDKSVDFKICPICHTNNDANALICRHCGAQLAVNSDILATQRIEDPFDPADEQRGQVTGEYTPPSKGISLYLLNRGEPIALRMEEEFIMGFLGETTSEPTVDLSGFEAFSLGVSRRHALIKSTGKKYVLVDLNSSNGTWLNGQRLAPTRPYDLPSGAVIQLGRLKLVVSYLRPPADKGA